ncbi:MAG: PIN domain-containing protein [Marinoscillum sp.]
MAGKVFLDTDVILDFLLDREPFSESASKLFDLGETGQLELFTSALAVNNIHYILRKLIGSKKSIEVVADLIDMIQCVEVGVEQLRHSIQSKFRDFEDGIQHATALKIVGLEAIITRNHRDFRKSQLPIFDPESFLHVIKKAEC